MSLELLGAAGSSVGGTSYVAEIKHAGHTWRPGTRVRWKGKNPSESGFLNYRKRGDTGVIHDDGSGRPLWKISGGRFGGSWALVRWDESRPTPIDNTRLKGPNVDEVSLDDLEPEQAGSSSARGYQAGAAMLAAKSCGADGDMNSWLLMIACFAALVVAYLIATRTAVPEGSQ